MYNITPDSLKILDEFKDRMHITHSSEDANLLRIIAASEKRLKTMCGDYSIDEDEDFKELVFERSRFAYNDALEHFDSLFQSQINTLGVNKALEEWPGDIDATI